ncbi:MAG: superoxide dismutase [Erysipelothrix sp.]|nr:superoxide dismutase [Erysipelothrix sp.]
MTYKLPNLDYAYDSLEPQIDARTMEIHHTKHHQAYIDNALAALEGHADLIAKDPIDLLKDIDSVPESIRGALRNNVGGHVNHALFWKTLTPAKGQLPEGDLLAAINKDFGSLDGLKEKLDTAAKTRFGSGWAWLVKDNDKLAVISTANQDSPYMDGLTPLLGLDVWEHAYYLNYQNRRPDYISAWFEVINWDEVAKNLANA